ncbi:hypothetical protein BY996DRAFT_6518271, partial [Phakopsora pachyrhizi]
MRASERMTTLFQLQPYLSRSYTRRSTMAPSRNSHHHDRAVSPAYFRDDRLALKKMTEAETVLIQLENELRFDTPLDQSEFDKRNSRVVHLVDSTILP